MAVVVVLLTLGANLLYEEIVKTRQDSLDAAVALSLLQKLSQRMDRHIEVHTPELRTRVKELEGRVERVTEQVVRIMHLRESDVKQSPHKGFFVPQGPGGP